MKEEIMKLWKQYTEVCKKREHEYFDYVVKNYGSHMYRPNKANTPSFEGFMDFLVAEPLSVQEGEVEQHYILKMGDLWGCPKCGQGDSYVRSNPVCIPRVSPGPSEDIIYKGNARFAPPFADLEVCKATEQRLCDKTICPEHWPSPTKEKIEEIPHGFFRENDSNLAVFLGKKINQLIRAYNKGV